MPKVEKNEKNIEDCSCPNCPSYNDCSHQKREALFCAQRANCRFEMQGCVCGSCPVFERNDLSGSYYCTKGTAEELSLNA